MAECGWEETKRTFLRVAIDVGGGEMAINIEYSQSFAKALNRMQKYEKDQIQKQIDLFTVNPRHPSLSNEKLEDNLHSSFRANGDIRVIYQALEGNTCLIEYVDHHEPAYDWANTHKFKIADNRIGFIGRELEPETVAKWQKEYSRLSVLTDEELIDLDIPSQYWESLKDKYCSLTYIDSMGNDVYEESKEVLRFILLGFRKEAGLTLFDRMKVQKPSRLPFQNKPFAKYSDEQLRGMGVPKSLLNSIRELRFRNELMLIHDDGYLPEIAFDNLYQIITKGADADSLVAATRRGCRKTETGSALEILNNPTTRQTIVEIKPEELQKFYDAPLETWRVFLHHSQRNIVEASFNGPARVLGGAGTGKTVIVAHRAKHLAESDRTGKILVTTYSKTLVKDIQNRIHSIIVQPEPLQNIEVRTLDSIVREYCRNVFGKQLVYEESGYRKEYGIIEKCWDIALEGITGVDAQFCMDEWNEVIQAQNIRSAEEYLQAARIGRGQKRLSQSDRQILWSVFTKYKSEMMERNAIDISWAENEMASSIINHLARMYSHIIVDECQDFKAPALRLIRAMAGLEHQDDLLLVGDSRQKIYKGRQTLSSSGIFVRNRSRQLTINYRTTSRIYEAALKIQKGYEYDDLDDNRNLAQESVCTIDGEVVSVRGYDSAKEEAIAVISDIKRRMINGCDLRGICIVSRDNRRKEFYVHRLTEEGIPFLRLDNSQGDDYYIDGVRICTMHRVKGMEFDSMYVVSVDADKLPSKKEYDDPNNGATERNDILKREANLLSVSLTRARKSAWISYVKEPSVLLRGLIQ